MFEAAEGMRSEYAELATLMADPAVLADVARALAPDWHDRYRSVDALAADL